MLAAGLVSGSGDWILISGLIYRVYAITGSTVASGLTMASSFAPQVLLSAVAGVFADRWDRNRTMITADLLIAAVLRALMIFALVTSIGEGIMSTLFTPSAEHVLHGTSQAFAGRRVRGCRGRHAGLAQGERIHGA